MNMIKSIIAVAVCAVSATVSAQFVHIPDFPVKKDKVEEVIVQADVETESTEMVAAESK